MSEPVPPLEAAPAFDVVAIGASLGGIAAISAVLAALPPFFPAAVLVTQHRSPHNHGAIFGAFTRRSRLPVHEPTDGDGIARGRVLLAPNDRHMVVAPDRTIRLSDDDRVQFARPSIDVMFRSVAAVYGPRAIAVVLTGRQSDGADGVRSIKAARGRVLAQDRVTSLSFDMPRAAIGTGCVDFVLPLDQLAPALVALATVPGAAELFRVPLPAWADLAEDERSAAAPRPLPRA